MSARHERRASSASWLLLLCVLGRPADGAAQATPALAPGQTVVDAAARGGITGEVVDLRAGGPAVGTVVALFQPRSTTHRRYPEPWVPETPEPDEVPIATVRSAQGGQFHFSGLAPGAYRVVPFAAGGAPVQEVWVVVEAEGEPSSVRLAVGIGGRLSGRVDDAEGRPAADASVFVAAVEGADGAPPPSRGRPDVHTRSDASGRFALPEVAPGILWVQAGRREDGYAAPQRIVVEPVSDHPDLVFRLPDDAARLRRGAEEHGGLGIVAEFAPGGVVLARVTPGSAAEAAGLLPADRVLAIGGRSTRFMVRHEFLSLARGGVGEPVTLTVQRADGDPFDVAVPRRDVRPR